MWPDIAAGCTSRWRISMPKSLWKLKNDPGWDFCCHNCSAKTYRMSTPQQSLGRFQVDEWKPDLLTISASSRHWVGNLPWGFFVERVHQLLPSKVHAGNKNQNCLDGRVWPAHALPIQLDQATILSAAPLRGPLAELPFGDLPFDP